MEDRSHSQEAGQQGSEPWKCFLSLWSWPLCSAPLPLCVGYTAASGQGLRADPDKFPVAFSCLHKIPLLFFAVEQVCEESDFSHCSSFIDLTLSLSSAFADNIDCQLTSPCWRVEQEYGSSLGGAEGDPHKVEPDTECGNYTGGSLCVL